jgi:hypothetical protein
MSKTKITLHNRTEIKTQALIFSGQMLVNVCLVAPGEICVLADVSGAHDIFLKNGATGWEIARALDNQATTLTLTRQNGGWFQILAS